MIKLLIFYFLSIAVFILDSMAATEHLKKLNIDKNTITVSGLSSGAFMAVQLAVIHSRKISGVAAFAGGIFGCAEGDLNKAKKACMQEPFQIDSKKFINKAKDLSRLDLIDDLENLNFKPMYIYSGSRDSIVRMESAFRLKEFSDYFSMETKIETSVASEHGFPTLNFGLDCNKKGEPWLVNCKFDGAGEMLNFLYKDLEEPAQIAKEQNLKVFDQKEFQSFTNFLHDIGFIYIPENCVSLSAKKCRLHVALHGCLQGPEYADQNFAKNAGYNRWAETNNIVVLYPSAKTGGLNLRGCWDWYGYSGLDYLTKNGKQIQALMKMINRVVGDE